MSTTSIVHEPDAKRYAMYLDGALVAIADYNLGTDAISFHHTFTNPKFRGRGLAGDVVTFAMDDVEKTSTRKVVPMCWYVADWFEAHPERAGLLTR
ncbi:GNAT family N-acetyltransferase [soil metagenome]